MNYRRTVILSGEKNERSKAVLTLDEDGSGRIKVFNLDMTKKYALGIKIQDEIIKLNLSMQNDVAYFTMPSKYDLYGKIFCALVDVTNIQNPSVVLSGLVVDSKKMAQSVELAFFDNLSVFKKMEKEDMYDIGNSQEIESIVEKNIN